MRLTNKDDQGNWCLKGLEWEQLHAGQVITRNVWEKLYGALWKLMEYEGTGLTPERIKELNNFEKTQTAHCLAEFQVMQRKHRWISVGERLPENDSYIMVSFDNFSLPDIGRYEETEEGGAFYPGDDDKSYISLGLFVNAWMPLPEPYKPDN